MRYESKINHRIGKTIKRSIFVVVFYIIICLPNNKFVFIMEFEHLFHIDTPVGVKTICYKGNTISIEKFEELKKNYWKKKRSKELNKL